MYQRPMLKSLAFFIKSQHAMKHSIEETGPEAEYHALMQAGELKPDTDQARAVASLERLHHELIDYAGVGSKRGGFSFKNGWLTGLLRRLGSNNPVPKGSTRSCRTETFAARRACQ